jgi:molybdate transport system substrate-binding protein
MTKTFFLTLILLVSMDAADAQSRSEKILVFAGAASKPATEEVIKRFSAETAVPVDVVFGGSGYVLSQMKLSRKGDLYFPGSSDFMEMAKREEWVFADSEKVIAYLIPAMNVQRGNPKRISALRDLTREGIRVGIAHPEKVCVGTYAVEIVEKNLSSPDKEKFRKNIVNYVESCEKTANVIALKAVDAVLVGASSRIGTRVALRRFI